MVNLIIKTRKELFAPRCEGQDVRMQTELRAKRWISAKELKFALIQLRSLMCVDVLKAEEYLIELDESIPDEVLNEQ